MKKLLYYVLLLYSLSTYSAEPQRLEFATCDLSHFESLHQNLHHLNNSGFTKLMSPNKKIFFAIFAALLDFQISMHEEIYAKEWTKLHTSYITLQSHKVDDTTLQILKNQLETSTEKSYTLTREIDGRINLLRSKFSPFRFTR